MKGAIYTNIILIFSFITLLSCDSLKYVGEGNYLIKENKILINGKAFKKKKKTLSKNISLENQTGLFVQKPNITSMGMPVGLYLYNIADSLPRENFDKWTLKKPNRKKKLENFLSSKQLNRLRKSYVGFNQWLKETGESPTIFNIRETEETAENFKFFYKNVGYFNAKVSYTVDTLRNGWVRVNYDVNTGKPYIIDKITTQIESPLIDSIYKNHLGKSYIRRGDAYDLEKFSKERKRLVALFQNTGIYAFPKNAINFEILADTISKNDNKIGVKLLISNPTKRENDSLITKKYKIHTIKDINVFIGKNDTKYNDSIQYRGTNIHFKNRLIFNPKLFSQFIDVHKGDIYREKDRTNTYKNLTNFTTMAYTGVEYLPVKDSDSTFIANIFMFPRDRFSFKINTDVSNSVIQDLGFSLNTSLVIRNVFRNGESLDISPRGSLGFQKQVGLDNRIINQYGININLHIPKILFFFNVEKFINKNMNPETQISIGSGVQENIGLDKQNLRVLMSYSWKPSSRVTHLLEPINIEFVQNHNINNFYNVYFSNYTTANNLSKSYPNLLNPTDIDENNDLVIPNGVEDFLQALSLSNEGADTQTATNILNRKQRLITNNFIFGANYTYNFNNRKSIEDNDFIKFTANVELSGNVLRLFSNSLSFDKNEQGQYLFSDIPFSQYTKVNMDFIKYISLSRGSVFAFRLFFGIAVPYGNSDTVPFIKSYFAGGSNDNRGWLAYSLGPGSSNTPSNFNEANMKITLSLENRFKLAGRLKGAIFADIGNIWNIYNNVIEENTIFQGLESLQDVAISTGLGLRYDLSFLIFRLDLGFKTYNPSLDIGQRWFSSFSFNQSVFNIAINYPF